MFRVSEWSRLSTWLFNFYIKRFVVHYKIILSEQQILDVTESVRIDQDLLVKLFIKSLPAPLPQWFRTTPQCMLKRQVQVRKAFFFSIFEELKLFQFKESNSLDVMQDALLLRYWSFLGYRLLLEESPLQPIFLLNNLKEDKLNFL